MELNSLNVICPECGKKIENSSGKCNNCGYQIKESSSIEKSKKKSRLITTIILLVAAIVCFTIAFIRLNDKYYKYCVSVQQEYQEEYAAAKAFTDEHTGAIFAPGNRLINEEWEELITDNQRTIWTYRIQAIALCAVGGILLIVLLFIRKKERK